MNQPARITFIPVTIGVTPFVYDTMPPGSRCAWACKWVTSQGVIQPGEWGSVDDMTIAELIAELSDLEARNTPGAREQLAHPVRAHLMRYLRKEREHYPEYVYPWDPPKTGYNIQYRPGWGDVKVSSAWRAI